jgi:hypothetical protein
MGTHQLDLGDDGNIQVRISGSFDGSTQSGKSRAEDYNVVFSTRHNIVSL